MSTYVDVVSDDNFVVNFRGDINTCKDLIAEVKTAELDRITSGDESATTVTL
jgi:hypothetical protein